MIYGVHLYLDSHLHFKAVFSNHTYSWSSFPLTSPLEQAR